MSIEDKLNDKAVLKFADAMNNLPSNIPDLGPHDGVNNPVREYTHVHIVGGDLTPSSRSVLEHTPLRINPVATSPRGSIVDTTGKTFALSSLTADTQKLINQHGTAARNTTSSFKTNYL
jgi:hypothetical protein